MNDKENKAFEQCVKQIKRLLIEEKQVYSDRYINMDLLQAINKQIEELGWNKEG